MLAPALIKKPMLLFIHNGSRLKNGFENVIPSWAIKNGLMRTFPALRDMILVVDVASIWWVILPAH